MNRLFRNLAHGIILLRWGVLLAFILVTIFLAQAAKTLQIDPSTDTLFAKNTPEFKFYQEFRKEFGSDHLIAIAVKTRDFLTLSNLRWAYALTTILSSDSRVDRVISLTHAMDIRHKVLGVKVEPVIAGVLEGERPLEEFKKEVLQNPLFQGNLISKDGKVGAILIRLKAQGDHPDFLRGYVSELRSYLKTFPWPGVEFFMAGSSVEQHDFVDAIRRDQMFFIPAVGLFLILAIYLIYRNVTNVIVAMIIVLVSLAWTFGTIALMGRALNLVNSLLAPVVMIIAVTNTIYLINLFSELRLHHASVNECIRLTLQHLGLPCLLTSATIMAGFLSLATNQVPAVRSFGLFAALGAFYSYVVAILLMPVLLPLLPFRRLNTVEQGKHLFNQVIVFYLEKIQFRLKWLILAGAVVFLALSAVGISKLRINTNLIKDLPPRSPLAVATHFIDRHLAGVYSLGVSIERSRPGPLATVETLKKVDALAAFLETQPEITKVNSLPMIIKKVHEAREGIPGAFKIPSDEATLQDYLERMAAADNPDFWSFISRDFRRLRLEARMKAVGTEQGRVMENRVWNYIHKNLGSEYKVQITGGAVLLGQMSEKLVTNQIQSLGHAFCVILALIVIFFRSSRMGLLACIPNLLPLIGVYGLMGFLGIELSTPTAMISSVVLGLVVDASIQFLYRFRYEFKERRHYLQALHHTYRNIGQAMVVTTMILVFGFASSVFASFRPTVYFGILTSLTVFFSLICTLVLLPIALIFLKPFGRQGAINRFRKHTLTPLNPSSIITD